MDALLQNITAMVDVDTQRPLRTTDSQRNTNIDSMSESELLQQLRILKKRNGTDHLSDHRFSADGSLRSNIAHNMHDDTPLQQEGDRRIVELHRQQQQQQQHKYDDMQLQQATNRIVRNQRTTFPKSDDRLRATVRLDSKSNSYANTTNRRYVTEGYALLPLNFHVPTTAQILAAQGTTRHQKDIEEEDRTCRSYHPEQSLAATQKRNRSISPNRGREFQQRIVTSVSAADFTPLSDAITIEMALLFEQQVACAPNVHLARDAIRNRARRNITSRLAFVHPSKLGTWWDEIACTTLAQMVIKYFGPQSVTTRKIDQSLMALPFKFNFSDRSDEEETGNLRHELLEVYSHGVFSAAQQVSTAKIIEKKTIRHDALYIDYQERKAEDLREGKPETVARCLLRITSCIQAVRDLNSIVTRYGPFNMTHVHTYPRITTGIDTDDQLGVMVTVAGTRDPSIPIEIPTHTVALPKAYDSAETRLDVPIRKRKPVDEPESFVAIKQVCHTCGMSDHATRNYPRSAELDINVTEKPRTSSPMGILWAKCGFTHYQTELELPDNQSTQTART